MTRRRAAALPPRTMPEAKEALRFQAALLDAVGQALIATDPTGVILYWNQAAEEMYGWSAAEAIGQPATEITPFEGVEEVLPAIIAGPLRDASWSGDIWVTRRDGSRFRAFVTDTPVYGRDGSLVAIIRVSVDVTEREAGEEARRQLACIVDSSGDAIFGLTLEGLVTSWNPAAQQLFGYTAEEMIGQPIFVITPEDKRQEQAAVRARIMAGGPAEHMESTRLRKDGSTVDVAISASTTYDGHGKVIGQSVILHDITARRAAERELLESRQRFEAQFRGNPVPTYTWLHQGDDFVMIEANDAANAISDDTIRGLLGVRATRFFADSPDIVEDMRRCAAGAQPVRRRMPFHMQTIGRDFVFEVDYVFIPPNLVMVHTLDVTDRDASERALRESEVRYRGLVETAGEGVWTIDADSATTFVNGRMAEMLGYRVDEMLGTSCFDYMDPESQSIAQEVLGRVDQDAAVQIEFKFTKRDGSHLWALAHTHGLIDAAGRMGALGMITDITDRHLADDRLRRGEQRLADAQRLAHIGSFELDVATGALSWSDEHFRILGLDPGAQPPSPEAILSRVHCDDLPELERLWATAVRQGVPFDFSYRITRDGGEERCVHMRTVAETDEYGTVIKMIGTLADETERVHADEVRRAAEARFEMGFEQAAIGATLWGLDGLATRVNPALCALMGRPEELLVGRGWAEYAHPDNVPLVEILARFGAGDDSYHDDRRYLRPDGSIVWASSHFNLVRDESGQPRYFFVQLEDITERKAMEEELAHQALHDSLTGLPARAVLTERLTVALAGTRRRGSLLAVMFLDVDHLKLLNDAAGHAAGDEALQAVGDCIAEMLRPGDTVGRFGGDEFVMVCEDVSAVEADEIALRVLSCVHEPRLIAGRDTVLSASIGIALSDADATAHTLLRDSDAAMFRAKQRGRGRAELFDDALRAIAERRLATELELLRALDHEEFAVHFQPIIDLASDVVVGAEALVRWEHPERGLLSPDSFIPAAEETGLIVPIGAWVLHEACRELAEWQRTDPSMSVAVNLSVRQLAAPDVVARVQHALRETGVPGESLCLEFTESVWMDDVDYFGRTMARLRALGVRLSIDDFGTGYSSLSYLKRFPLDEVKIDRGFVDGLGTDPHDSALVAAILAMAEALELEVTAEGVETNDQLQHLKAMRCQRAQGFFLARPMPAPDMRHFVMNRRKRPVVGS